jgi:hypothetical protein
MTGDLVRVDPLATLARKGVTPTETGLVFDDPEMPFDEWEQVGRMLGRASDWSAFAIGDWLLAGEAMYGQAAYQAAEATGRSEESLDQLVRVAERIPRSRRRPGVAWSLHRLVKNLEPREQLHWLGVADEYRLTYRELEQQLRSAGLVQTRVSAVEAAESVDPADPHPTSTDAVGDRETGADDLRKAAHALICSAEPLGLHRSSVPRLAVNRLQRALNEQQLPVVDVKPDPKRPSWA